MTAFGTLLTKPISAACPVPVKADMRDCLESTSRGVVMSEAAMPISAKLADAFFEAVREYVRWGFLGPEPNMHDDQGKLVSISTVCRRIDVFTDPLPDEVFEALCFLATQKHLKEKLGAERSYATGAQILLSLIEHRKAEWGLA